MHGRYVVLGIPICSVIERGVWAGKGLHPVALLVHASKYFVPTRYVQIYISIACRLLITIALNPFAFALLSFDISCDSRAKQIRLGQAPFCHANYAKSEILFQPKFNQQIFEILEYSSTKDSGPKT
jgi:hypothetical protein